MSAHRVLGALGLAVTLLAAPAGCIDESGLPDPPPRPLVPCDADAGADQPLACPPAADGGADL